MPDRTKNVTGFFFVLRLFFFNTQRSFSPTFHGSISALTRRWRSIDVSHTQDDWPKCLMTLHDMEYLFTPYGSTLDIIWSGNAIKGVSDRDARTRRASRSLPINIRKNCNRKF